MTPQEWLKDYEYYPETERSYEVRDTAGIIRELLGEVEDLKLTIDSMRGEWDA